MLRIPARMDALSVILQSISESTAQVPMVAAADRATVLSARRPAALSHVLRVS